MIIRRGSPCEVAMPSGSRFRTEARDGVAVLWIDNPPRNLLRLSMISELAGLVESLEKDEAVRAVVVAGAEHANFCSGLDMAEWAKLTSKDSQDAIGRGQDAFWALEHVTKPTIASIAGAARGAGAELALACDLRIGDETAVFSHPEVDLGWMPSHGGTARLSKVLGRSRALEILVTGKEVKALDALRIGLINHLASPGGAFDQSKALAAAFAAKPRSAVRAIKRALTEGDEKPYRNRFLLESQHAVQLLWTEEYKAGMEKIRGSGKTPKA